MQYWYNEVFEMISPDIATFKQDFCRYMKVYEGGNLELYIIPVDCYYRNFEDEN